MELHWTGRLTGSGEFVEALPILPVDAAGLFETVRITRRDRVPPLWPLHRERLVGSLRALEVVDERSAPMVAAQLDRFVSEVLGHAVVALPPPRELGVESHERLRLAITFDATRGPHGAVPGVRITIGPADPAPTLVRLAPVGFRMPVTDLPPSAHKHLDRRAWTLAQADARRCGADEALRIDDEGRVLESTTSNLWVAMEGRLVTPATDGRILPGVARAALLERLSAHGVKVDVRPIQLMEAEAAEGLWLTNALRGPRQAVLVDRQGEPPSAGTQGALLVSAWHRLVGT